MIFLSNVLVMNGGSTFLIRTCRELKRQGIPTLVLVLRRQVDVELLAELKGFAEVIFLDEYLIDKALIFRAHLGVFGPVAWGRVKDKLRFFGNVVHAMGLFGLLFGRRLCAEFNNFTLTTGVYHQNEFLFHKSRFFFPNNSARLFNELPPENIVFFNEASRNNYSRFFTKDYSDSSVLPIGIDLPSSFKGAFNPDAYRIVSVGNLVEFKTYNEHIIRALPSLRRIAPRVRYDIYGTGPKEQFLRKLAQEVGVEDIVFFKGDVLYSKLKEAFADATLFVGSGTALLEAAARGIPALIGIESIRVPETYGFISDVDGYSYNEDVPYIEKYSIAELLRGFFCDSDIRISLSEKCSRKAKIFSVEKTAHGFVKLKGKALRSMHYFGCRELSKMIFSFVLMVLFQRIIGEPPFSERRNESHKIIP